MGCGVDISGRNSATYVRPPIPILYTVYTVILIRRATNERSENENEIPTPPLLYNTSPFNLKDRHHSTSQRCSTLSLISIMISPHGTIFKYYSLKSCTVRVKHNLVKYEQYGTSQYNAVQCGTIFIFVLGPSGLLGFFFPQATVGSGAEEESPGSNSQ